MLRYIYINIYICMIFHIYIDVYKYIHTYMCVYMYVYIPTYNIFIHIFYAFYGKYP